MIHPFTKLEYISDEIGYGVFASAFIPAGSILYIRDPLEVCIMPDSPLLEHPSYRTLIDKYSYIEPTGEYVISWDIAKYVNHSCNANSLSTGYGFEIAVRDIEPGEQITDDYGMLNMEQSMDCACGSSDCRKKVHGSDPERMADIWDEKVQSALMKFRTVDQPLGGLIGEETEIEIRKLFESPENYRSVRHLFFQNGRKDASAEIPKTAV